MRRVPILFCVVLAWALSPAALYAVTLSDVIAFWPFDETSGTHFGDASGNGHVATFGAELSPAITVGECPSLDASYATRAGTPGTNTGLMLGWDQLVVDDTLKTSLVDIPTVPTFGTDFAVSFWLGDDQWASEYGVITSYNNGAGREWAIGISGNELIAGSNGGTAPAYSYSTPVTGFTSGYHHVLAQFAGNSVSALYIDGQLVSNTATSAWFVATSTGFTLGARERDAVSYPVTGVQMDDFAVIDGTVTAAQALDIATAGNSIDTVPGLTLNTHLKLDETSGSLLADSSGNGNNGNLVQWSLLDPQDVSGATAGGVFGAGARFDRGAKEFAQFIPNNLPKVGQDPFTTTFWLKLEDWSSGGNVITWDEAGSSRFNVAVNGGRIYVYASSDEDGLVRSFLDVDEDGLNLTDGEFAHFAVTLDEDSNISLFVNGELQVEHGNNNAYYPATLNTAAIGARTRNSLGFVDNALLGVLDDLALFQGVLGEAEVKFIMSQGVAAIPEPTALMMLFCGGLWVLLGLGRHSR